MNKIIENITRFTAYTVNYIFHPVLMPFYLFLILGFYSSLFINNPVAIKMTVVSVVAMMTIGVPAVSIGVTKLASILFDKHTTHYSYNNIASYVVFIIAYIAVIYTLKDFITLRMSLRIFITPFFLIIFFFILRRFGIRVSKWMAGMVSLISFLYLFSLFGINGIEGFILTSLIACGVLGSARMYLNKDSLTDIAIGSSLGIAASFFSFFTGGIL